MPTSEHLARHIKGASPSRLVFRLTQTPTTTPHFQLQRGLFTGKMLAAPSSSPHHNPFLPFHSSPLARDARRATFNFAMNPEQTTNYTRPNPKTAPKLSTERLNTSRRGAFFKRVREGREDRRWEVRGEDIMRADFLARQKAWEAAQAQNAPVEEEDGEEEAQLPEEDTHMDVSSQQPAPEEYEDMELEALLEFMPEEEEMRDDGESLWSDDVDYEALFEQVLSQEEVEGPQQNLEQRVDEGGEEMDMT